MNERRARTATWLEAFETARPASPSWGDDDRAWADRVALEAAGPEAAGDEFVAQRAGHAMQRLAVREPIVSHALGATVWRTGGVVLVVAIAFIGGLLADAIGSDQRINLMAPPLWGVLAWNVVVYALLLAWPIVRRVRRRARPDRPGPIVRAMEWLLRARRRLPSPSVGGAAVAARRFATLWSERCQPLTALRIEALLHAGAAALAIGLVAGLYARGLVLDYRAVWESTFLDAAAAHAIVATAFAPASQLSGIAIPDEAAFAAMRAVPGQAATSAPAAPWIHLVALTLVLVVIVPRALLAAGCAVLAARRTRRFALPLQEPYYQRLLRLQRGARAQVVVFPYGHTLSPPATLGLRALLAESFGPRVDLQFAPTAPFGAEDEAAIDPPSTATHGLALFDLAATPEPEHHGRFLRRIGAALPPGASLAVLLDATAFARRFGGVGERLAQRAEAWRLWGEPLATTPVVVDLEGAEPASAEPLLRAAFALPMPAAAGAGAESGEPSAARR
ncbi:MAG: DUF2868 domain-containing protein [Caldimonas sp.]